MATTCNDLIDLSGDYPAIGKLTLTDDAPLASGKPAPEPSGPNAPATPEELNVKVSADTLKRYADSLQLIQTLSLDGVQLKAQQQHYKVQQLQRDIGKTSELLGKLMGVCAKEREQMDKLDDDKWYPGKLLKGKKAHAEKVEGQQAKLDKAEDELDKQRARLMQLQQDEQRGRAEAEALDKKVAQLLRAQEFEAAVVQQLFQGAGGDDKENELEQGAARSKQKLDGLAQYKTMYGKTEKILQSALSHATQAEQACEQASRMARADLAQDVFSPMPMMNGPAGIMIDASKHRAFQASAHHAAAAAQLVMEAKQLMPSMPEVDLPKMKKFLSHPGLGMDMVFDNAFTDVRSMRKIQDALSDVHDLRRDTEKALRWVQEWLHTRIDRDYDAAESAYRADKATLDEHRRALMQRMIAAL